MVKEIPIGGKPVKFKMTAAFPLVYRELTGREFFKDSQDMAENGSLAFDLLWVMHKHAEPDDTLSEMEWLEQFDFADLNEAIPAIVDMMARSEQTQSDAKKNSGR